MKSNVGNIDKIVRISIAVIVGVLYFTGQIGGLVAIVLGAVAVVLAVTSFVSFCPLYAPFRISTRPKEN